EATFIYEWTQEIAELSAVDMYDMFNQLNVLRERAARFISGFDFLVLPTVPCPPFAADLEGPTQNTAFAPWANCFLFNLTGQPASSVPCGITKSGLPVGMQIVGRRYDDTGVLKLSRIYEKISQKLLGAD